MTQSTVFTWTASGEIFHMLFIIFILPAVGTKTTLCHTKAYYIIYPCP